MDLLTFAADAVFSDTVEGNYFFIFILFFCIKLYGGIDGIFV